MNTYCEYIRDHPEDVINCRYHDLEYGFPLEDEALLFERLMLEINQAGLSWNTILKKKNYFQKAYDGFDINIVAEYGELERKRLLEDAGIIRNRLKINAAIENAKRIRALHKDFGSFKGWLDINKELSKGDWVNLFRHTFVFTGGEIVENS